MAFFMFAAPALEARLAPVLTDQRIVIEADDRKPGRMCWTWHWVKRRYAQPVVVTWSIAIDNTAVAIPVVAEREADGFALRTPATHSPGAGRNDLCVKIPDHLDKSPGMTIKGSINYRTSHGLWTVWQDMPTVKVPPL
jgi:hypothetical protein